MPDHAEQLPLTPLTMAILLSLAEEDRHGYALMTSVEEQTDGALTPGTGSLYAALERLGDEGLIEEVEEPGPRDGRARKTYRITGEGRDLARAEAARLLKVVQVARERRLAPDPLPAPGSEA